MKGHGEKFSRKQEEAIAALLASPTLAEAARAAGIGEATLWRWLQQEDFRRRYEEARRELVRQALVYVQGVIGEAVKVLRQVMNGPAYPATAKVSAARTLLEAALKAGEAAELEERIARLERLMEGREQYGLKATC